MLISSSKSDFIAFQTLGGATERKPQPEQNC